MALLKLEDIILWEDDSLVVINKPAGISTLADRVADINIHDLAKKVYPGVQVCHRLDKDTSGALILAKDSESYKEISRQFESREIKKVYHAVVDGLHDFKDLKTSKSLYQTGRGKSRVSSRGKPSMTIFNTLTTYKYHTLIECLPVTGRTHQIRAHLRFVNAPIVGDLEYGGKSLFLSQLKKNYNLKKFTEELPLIKRMALHAFSIQFKAISGKILKIEAPYPKDFKVLIKNLEKYG